MQQSFAQNHKLDSLVRQQVVSSLREILSDPDFGLNLKPTAFQKLRKSIRSKKAGRYRSLEDVVKKYQ